MLSIKKGCILMFILNIQCYAWIEILMINYDISTYENFCMFIHLLVIYEEMSSSQPQWLVALTPSSPERF